VIGSFPLFDGMVHEIFTVLCEIIVALMTDGESGNTRFCGDWEFCDADWPDGFGADDVLVGVMDTRGEGFVSEPADNNAVTA
jgi:hypothetical protein